MNLKELILKGEEADFKLKGEDDDLCLVEDVHQPYCIFNIDLDYFLPLKEIVEKLENEVIVKENNK